MRIGSFIFFLTLLPIIGFMANDGYNYAQSPAGGLQLASVQEVLETYVPDQMETIQNQTPESIKPLVEERIMPMSGVLFGGIIAVLGAFLTGSVGLFFPKTHFSATYQKPGKPYKYSRKD